MIGYVSLDEAKEFLKNRYEEVSEQELSKGLYKALDKIESLSIRDSGRSETQELIFPRINEKKVPDEIKKAQIIEAYSIVKDLDDDNTSDIEKGIASKSIGDMSISYNSNASNSIGSIIFANAQAKNILYKYVRKTYDWS
ncbi:DnaT-like ssDNA-binding protein [Fusobacterium pseudoperiodonticum]|uniref:DnaT-like ssDNA-binding protein n=1 Tax=Fusobacterium pseudoperiodonticum TaxID=2663009 RepID=UPI0028EF1527|nr:DnaT-like ssDNA-binding protein [Fusobacterium pseudoperiodonticum]